MPADPLLYERLKSYLDRQSATDSGTLQPRPGLPAQLAALGEIFPLFEWVTAGGGAQVFGIRRLVDQAPFRLSDLRARGFRTESVRHPVRPPIKGSVEHYLIAQLLTAEAAVVYLCMYAPSGEWYLLDEHRITRRAAER